MVTWENYEEYMMLHADGELQVAEEQALIDFVSQHPELNDEMELCAAVKLVPDTAVVYANKESLIKPVPATKKVIAMPMWRRYAVAAGVAAVICLSVLKYNSWQSVVGSRKLAVSSHPVGSSSVGGRQSVVGSHSVGNSSVDSKGVGSEVVNSGKVVLKEKKSKHEVFVAATMKSVSKHEVISEERVQEVAVVHEQIAEIMPAETKTLPVQNEPVKLMAVNDVPAVSLGLQEESKKTLLESLPIEDIKKDGMTDVAGALAQTYKKMNALKHIVTDEKNISVRVEKKQLIVSF